MIDIWFSGERLSTIFFEMADLKNIFIQTED